MFNKIICSLFLGVFVFSSCEEVFYEVDISNVSVEILSPTNNVNLSTGVQTFKWNPVDGADMYQIQIATPNFENAIEIVLDSIIIKTSINEEFLVPNNYQWRVKAKNFAYETAFTTSNFSVGY